MHDVTRQDAVDRMMRNYLWEGAGPAAAGHRTAQRAHRNAGSGGRPQVSTVEPRGLEPRTPALQRQCSAS